jgi:hypothetical protein
MSQSHGGSRSRGEEFAEMVSVILIVGGIALCVILPLVEVIKSII